MPHAADGRPEPSATDSPRERASARRPGGPRWALLAVAAGLVAASLLPGAVLAEDPSATLPPSAPPSAAPTTDPSLVFTPDPAPAADPTADPSVAPAADPSVALSPTPVIITRNLYRADAVVTQYTSFWCVPASVQTMTNIILGTRDTSYATQKLVASITYRFNRYRYDGPGNDIRGWAGALNWRLPDTLPVVYRDRSYPSRTAALDAIVDAIEETGYPVGITVWHGSHAWAVVGYRISQVPDDPTTREILGFYVVGPLGSPRDPWPVRYVTVLSFGADYTRYYEDEYREPWHMDYVLVRPERTRTWSRDWPRP